MRIRYFVDPQTGEPRPPTGGAGESDEAERISPWLGRRSVRRVLAHYESQTDEEAVAEDEVAFESRTETLMEIPNELVPAVRELIAKFRPER